jgi:hypothetical protein
VDVIVLLAILLASMSLGIFISRASVEVIFKIMRLAPAPVHRDSLRPVPAADAPRGPVTLAEQDVV